MHAAPNDGATDRMTAVPLRGAKFRPTIVDLWRLSRCSQGFYGNFDQNGSTVRSAVSMVE